MVRKNSHQDHVEISIGYEIKCRIGLGWSVHNGIDYARIGRRRTGSQVR